ncbi:MAG: HAD-IA family hydrolase [Phycisphaerales bacterium]|nr:HAD-IA family hydrolase [Phycisphaerales bacterium]
MNGSGVLFDLDGTLVDSLDSIHAAVVHAVGDDKSGVPDREEVASYVGDGSQVLLHRALSRNPNGRVSEQRHAEAYRAFQEHYPKVSREGTRVRDHAREVLRDLRAQGCRLAVVTNKNTDQALMTLEHLGLTELLDGVVTGQALGVFKPAPKPLRHALSLVGADDGVMVGDSVVDLQAATAAGLPFVGIRGGYNRGRDIATEQPPPDVVISELDELPAALATLWG